MSNDSERVASAKSFDVLFEASPVSVQVLASDGRTLRVNPAWDALWQLSEDDGVKAWILSGEYNVLTDPQLEKKGVTPYLQRAFRGEVVEIPAVKYDPAELGLAGRARMVSARACPVLDAQGKVEQVLLMHRDVTEQHLLQLAMQDRDQRLRLATDAAKIGIWDWDISKDVVAWTPEVYALHGMALGEFAGTAASFAERVHPEDRGWLWSRIEQAISEESGFSAEFRVILPGGADRWLSTSSRVYRGEDGSRRMVGATFSVDSFKKAEAALKDSDRRKDEFLAMLAHELRNPLAPIRSAAEILAIGSMDESKSRRAGEVIRRQVGHMSRLLEDLLDVSRVTRGLSELQAEPLRLDEVVAAAIEQTAPLFETSGHVLAWAIEAPDVHVHGDRARLIQVVVNILGNASRYTPNGGRIAVALHAREGFASIEVTDNGQGISADLLPHVFELFTQGPRTPDRSVGGLGIGLALVKSLVEMHGGTVEAASAGGGKGSTFTVKLPLLLRAGISPHVPGPERLAAQRTLHIVVVDDNADAADSLALLLETEGHRVNTCYTAAQALALGTAPHLFLLDIGLPDLDGIELARRLKSRHPHASFIATSGYGQPSDREQTHAAGFSAHLVKPVAWEELKAALAALPKL